MFPRQTGHRTLLGRGPRPATLLGSWLWGTLICSTSHLKLRNTAPLGYTVSDFQTEAPGNIARGVSKFSKPGIPWRSCQSRALELPHMQLLTWELWGWDLLIWISSKFSSNVTDPESPPGKTAMLTIISWTRDHRRKSILELEISIVFLGPVQGSIYFIAVRDVDFGVIKGHVCQPQLNWVWTH